MDVAHWANILIILFQFIIAESFPRFLKQFFFFIAVFWCHINLVLKLVNYYFSDLRICYIVPCLANNYYFQISVSATLSRQ